MSVALRGTIRSILTLLGQGEAESAPKTPRVPTSNWGDDNEDWHEIRTRPGRWEPWDEYYPARQHWGAAVLCKLEGIIPLQPNAQLLTPDLIKRVWRAQFGLTDLSTTASVYASMSYIAHHAKKWWEEAYHLQLARNFPCDDIDFLLDRGDDILRDMQETEEAIAQLVNKLEWINVGRAWMNSARAESPRPMDIKTVRRGNNTITPSETQSLINLLSTSMTPLSSVASTSPETSRRQSTMSTESVTSGTGGGSQLSRRPSQASSRRRKSNGSSVASKFVCDRQHVADHPHSKCCAHKCSSTPAHCVECEWKLSEARREITFELHAARMSFNAAQRLIAIRETIRCMLTYLRGRARIESSALNARENARKATREDAAVLERLLDLDHWHISRELRLDHLEKITVEWFDRIPDILKRLTTLDLQAAKLQAS